MPGLGDALSKAFEDSMHDLDALVDKAAQEEEDIAEAIDEATEEGDSGDEAGGDEAVETAAEQGVGQVEKTTLFAAEDLSLEEASPSTADPEPPGDSVPPPRTERTRRITISEDMADAAARSGIDATRILEEAALRGASAEPGDPGLVAAAVEEPGPKTVELSAAAAEAVAAVAASAEPPAPPQPISDPTAKTQVTMAEPVAPFAQFAPSGIIRRKVRRGGAVEAAVPTAIPVDDPAPKPDPKVTTVEKTTPVHGSAPSAPSGVDEDVLATCRRVAALENAEDYRIPLLAEGVDSLVELIRSADGDDPAIMAICGAGTHFGTTTVAVACALKLAEDGGKRVLLLDADFRVPGVARLLGESADGPDLKAVLSGEATLPEAVLYSPEDNLAVLPIYGWGEGAGAGLSKMRSLLKSDFFVGLLEICERQFDHVIVDAGSVAEWDGPALVAGAAGRAVVTVRSGRMTIKRVREMKSRLARCGGRLEGSVLTFA